MKNFKTNLLFLILFLIVTGRSFSQDQIYTIKGNIVDENDDVAIEGAWVSVLDLKSNLIIKKIETTSEGVFEIDFEKGKYHLSFGSEKHQTLLLQVDY